MKVVLIGARGQLGTDLNKVLERRGATVLPITRAELDITNPEQVNGVLTAARPDAVINTAAFHKLDDCEKQPAIAFDVNAIAPRQLAQTCEQLGSTLVHISTDYVFGGDRRQPFAEEDCPCPISVYGDSKLAGEYLVASCMSRYFVVRTCGLYGHAGSSGKGGNFVENMLKRSPTDALSVVTDQVATPTATADLAEAITRLMVTDAYGLYHASSEGQCSWYEFTCAIFELAGISRHVNAVTTPAHVPGAVRRPQYSVLSKKKLASLGIAMPHWRDALARYIQTRPQPRPDA